VGTAHKCNSIPWAGGNTGLCHLKGSGFKSYCRQSFTNFVHFMLYYLSPKFFFFFTLKYGVFFTRKKYLKKPYSLNPVNEPTSGASCLRICNELSMRYFVAHLQSKISGFLPTVISKWTFLCNHKEMNGTSGTHNVLICYVNRIPVIRYFTRIFY
jgi:hypothetical protein